MKDQKIDRSVEDQLADFTDQVLKRPLEKQERFAPDPELRALQQTVLRLKNVLPEDGPSEAAVRRMRKNVVTQWEQKEEMTGAPFWKRFISPRKPSEQKWQPQENRRRKTLFIYLAAAGFLLLVSVPFLFRGTSLQPAASGHHWNAGLFLGINGLFLLVLWFIRRKR